MEIILEGRVQDADRRWPVGEGTHQIGRSRTSQVILQDPSVSRHHAEITVAGEIATLVDLESRNGTWVNGKAIRGKTSVRQGDRLRFGNVELVVRGSGSCCPPPHQTVPILCEPGEVHSTLQMRLKDARQAVGAPTHLDRDFIRLVTESGHLLVGREPLEHIFETVLDMVVQMVPTRRILLMLLDDKGANPSVRASRPPEAATSARLAISRTMLDSVIEQRESLVVGDALADPRFGGHESVMALNVRSAMVAPLFDNEKVIGLIYADSDDPTVHYDSDHLRVFTMLANLIAVRITQARLMEAESKRERMEQEMETAARIQRALLPASPPEEPGYEIRARMLPCFETAGDLYDVQRLDDGTIAVVIGDVSGKGIGSALLMSHIMASLRVLYGEGLEPARLVERLHAQVMRFTEPSHYATLFFGRLDPVAHTLDYVNAGHNPPYLIQSKGEARCLDSTGPPVGLLADSSFAGTRIDLPPRSLLCGFSDGITEAAAEEEFYGEERLLACLQRCLGEDLDTIAETVMEDVRGFVGNNPANDDITLLLIRRGT